MKHTFIVVVDVDEDVPTRFVGDMVVNAMEDRVFAHQHKTGSVAARTSHVHVSTEDGAYSTSIECKP